MLEQTADATRCVTGGPAGYSWVRRDASGIEGHSQRCAASWGMNSSRNRFQPHSEFVRDGANRENPPWAAYPTDTKHHHHVRIYQYLGWGVSMKVSNGSAQMDCPVQQGRGHWELLGPVPLFSLAGSHRSCCFTLLQPPRASLPVLGDVSCPSLRHTAWQKKLEWTTPVFFIILQTWGNPCPLTKTSRLLQEQYTRTAAWR